MINILSRLLDTNEREISRLRKTVEKINSFQGKIAKLKDDQLAKKTSEFKKRIKNGEKLDEILPESFAVVREVAKRVDGRAHYDVQLLAAVALFEGKIIEQKTGEGKTFTAIPALYLRALFGEGAHLVTVNDYLARRDAGWNAPIFAFLGLGVGVLVQENKSYIYDPEYTDSSHGDERLSHLKSCTRKEAYAADITYGTNNEFGFDYLRDNMVSDVSQMVQRSHYYAIVDEVDSVLIDEARTPLIISAPDSEPTQKYYQFAKIVNQLNEEHYTIDEKSKSATLTEEGIEKIEKILGVDNLYEKDFDSIHHIENALRARALYLNDREYIVKDNEVVIVDEFTGRLMPGRRWSDGLHQAVEAKEGVPIKQESKTLATISFQNYFRMYMHLSGMTGTAVTEAEEFKKIYNLDVVAVPTHRPMVRKDGADSIYKNLNAKYSAIADDILERHKKGQPVLVGTTSIEKNEIVSELLKKRKIPHNVLNAKNHEKEALILAQAGRLKAVTVATNMAGRGVDIILGGSKPGEKEHEEVLKLGGLHVIGTERHESRRIDNQLRGRSGRQGDPGSTRFYLSLEDDLMRIFGGEQIGRVMDRLNIPEDQPIENPLVSKAIEQAQVKVEGFHFDTRKRLVEYDDVNNQQREVIYKLRRRILESDNLSEEILEKLMHQVDKLILVSWPEDLSEQSGGSVDYERIMVGLLDMIPFDEKSREPFVAKISKINDRQKLSEFLYAIVRDAYEKRSAHLGEKVMREVEKYAYLGAVDHLWIDHIDHMDHLRGGIELRSIGQRDPIVEFKNEAFNLFDTLIDRIGEEVSHRIFRINVIGAPEIPLDQAITNEDVSDKTGLVQGSPLPKTKRKSTDSKIGRNDPCWCGSGKKWKKCHFPQKN